MQLNVALPDDGGRLYERAKQIVLGSGNTGIVNLQRKLGIPFCQAQKYLQQMEAEGLVGPADPQGWRYLKGCSDA